MTCDLIGSEPAKKRLPAWIRDGLAKAGRDLQKKMHVEMEEQQLALSQKQNDRQEQSAIEVGNDEIPAGLRRISGYDQSVSRTPSPPTDEVSRATFLNRVAEYIICLFVFIGRGRRGGAEG